MQKALQVPSGAQMTTPSYELTEIFFTKEQLFRLSDEERELVLRLGLVVNELMFFQRVLGSVLVSEPRSDVIKDIWITQVYIALMTLTGKVHEALLILDRFFVSSTVGRDWQPALKGSAQTALDQLRRSLGKGSLLADVRNSFAFHFHSSENLSPHMATLKDDEQLSLYAGMCDANTVHHFALESVVTSLTVKTKSDSAADAFNKVANEAAAVIRAFQAFVIGCEEIAFEKMGAVGRRSHSLNDGIIGQLGKERFEPIVRP
jgi:hypothetical protein